MDHEMQIRFAAEKVSKIIHKGWLVMTNGVGRSLLQLYNVRRDVLQDASPGIFTRMGSILDQKCGSNNSRAI